ncbi:MAG: haloacid dehalogenase-like hydrolase [Clostridiales bacterium]|nr:haloacid dehalogenase-like hydrolase [Clostridiales bacterium]
MRVFDFDNTIYDGESVFDFYLFSIRYNPKVAKYIFTVIAHLIDYKRGKTTMQDLEDAVIKYSGDYLTSFSNPSKMVSDFWDSHIHKIKSWYKPHPDDVILTASFNLMMKDVCERMGIEHCICSRVNEQTLQVEYLNFSSNKKTEFLKTFGNQTIDGFYTDNMFDKPMIDLAENAYLVKGNKIKKIK